MKCLLDENADLRIADFLAQRGHDVTAIARDYQRSLPDQEMAPHPMIITPFVTALGTAPIVGRGIIDEFKLTLLYGRRVIVEP